MNEFETPETEDHTNFGKTLAKEFVTSTAVSVGVLTGFIAVGLAYQKVKDFRANRKIEKVHAKIATGNA